MHPVPLRLIASTAALLSLALACGGKPDPALTPDGEPAASSTLGSLLGETSAGPSAGVASAQDLEAPPTTANAPSPLAEAMARQQGAAAAEEAGSAASNDDGLDVFIENTDCTEAKAALKEARAGMDLRRTRELPPLEEAMLRAEAAYRGCFAAGASCVEDYDHLNTLKKSADANKARFEAGQQRMLEAEAALFPLVQQVDRACGRQ